MQLMRLDKYLSDMGAGTRSQVRQMIRKGRVAVDGEVRKSPESKVDSAIQQVTLDGSQLAYAPYEYYMLNKPAGVVSATADRQDKTVMELVHGKRKDLFPVGRLDKDTEGLLFITNDGELSHSLLSPKNHVEKTYYAKVRGLVTEKDQEAFKKGLLLTRQTAREEKKEGLLQAMPAELSILKAGEISEVELTITEGKFHQVKRMFQAVGKEVLFLKRISMGSVMLDGSLGPGQCRPLTKEEVASLKGGKE